MFSMSYSDSLKIKTTEHVFLLVFAFSVVLEVGQGCSDNTKRIQIAGGSEYINDTIQEGIEKVAWIDTAKVVVTEKKGSYYDELDRKIAGKLYEIVFREINGVTTGNLISIETAKDSPPDSKKIKNHLDEFRDFIFLLRGGPKKICKRLDTTYSVERLSFLINQ